MIAYKLTDRNGFTRKGLPGETFWSVGSVVSPTGEGTAPCGPGVLHAYNHPLIAVLLDPIHARYGDTARLFEIDAESWETDECERWTTHDCRVLRELELPKLSREERIATALILAPHPITREWAIKWLSGEDRTARSAQAGARAAVAAAKAVAEAEAAEAAEAGAKVAAWAAAWAAAEAAGMAWAAEVAAEAAAVVAVGWAALEAHSREAREEFEAKIPRAIEHARKILSGEIPAELAWSE